MYPASGPTGRDILLLQSEENVKRYLFAYGALIFLVAPLTAFAQSRTEDEVRKAMADNIAAVTHKDAATLNRLYAEDYYRIGDAGRTEGKADFLKLIMDPGNTVEKVDRSDVKIRIFGDVAVVTGVDATTGKSKRNPELHQGPRERFTEVWVNHNGAWQKTVAQFTSTSQVPASVYRQ